MEFKTTSPHFHQAAMATAFTLAIISPAASFAICETPVSNPLMVNIATESEDPCDDQVSLREAITYANNTLGKDSVTFADSLEGHTIDLSGGGIIVTEDLKIEGNADSSKTILKAADNAPLFYLRSGGYEIDFELSGATLVKDSAYDHLINMQSAQYGGDILLDNIQTTEATKAYGIIGVYLNDFNGNATDTLSIKLKNSAISGSTFSDTIIDVDGQDSDGKVNISIENSSISYVKSNRLINSRTRSDTSINIHKTNIDGENWGGKGSRIINAESESNATIVVSESSIKNFKSEPNSIVSARANSIATTTIIDSTISANTASNLVNSFPHQPDSLPGEQQSNVDIINSDINSNTIYERAILASGLTGQLYVKNSKITGNNLKSVRNSFMVFGDDIDVIIQDSVISDNGALPILTTLRNDKTISILVENTTISGNNTLIPGSGIYVTTKGVVDLNIVNSTLSGNQAAVGVTANSTSGGAIFAYSDDRGSLNLSLENSTITNNSTSGYGGGIALEGTIENINVNISNSIVAGNTSAFGSDNDLSGNFNIQNSLIGYTSTTDSRTTINGTVIDQIGNGEGQTPDTGNNILGQDPLLQSLALSGGTWVHQLTAESPAINAGDAQAENLTEFDQRGEGFARIRTGNGVSELDLGAVQYFANPVAVNDEVSIVKNSSNNSIQVLQNDAENSDGLPLDAGSLSIMTHPENGSADTQEDGHITYTPNEDFIGEDTLTYVVQDTAGNTSTEATVSITVAEAASAGSGGSLNLWLLSLFGLLGLRRKKS